MNHRVDCAWCGKHMHGDLDSAVLSHGICGTCVAGTGLARVDELHGLDPEDADRLPFGLLHLDHDCRVVKYNFPEAERAGLDREWVIGKDFFQDVAPCTRVQEFEGRLRGLQDAGVPGREEFSFVFQFRGGSRLVHVLMSHSPKAGTVILVEDQG